MRFVRIWGQLCCCSEKPFCLLTLAVVRQEKAKVKICLRIGFIELDGFAECLSGRLFIPKSIVRVPQEAQRNWARGRSNCLFKPRFRCFAHLSKDLHLSLSKIRNRELPLRAKMSCRLLRRQEMPFLSQSIFPASGLYVPPCRSNRAVLSWMRGVAMHRMQPRDCPIVLRPLQLPAGPILRFSDDSLAVANYPKSYGRGQLLRQAFTPIDSVLAS